MILVWGFSPDFERQHQFCIVRGAELEKPLLFPKRGEERYIWPSESTKSAVPPDFHFVTYSTVDLKFDLEHIIGH